MTDVMAEKIGMTLDDLIALGSNARIEIMDGEIIEMHAAGGLHQLIGKNIWKPLDEYVMTEEKDWIFYHGLMYLIHSDQNLLKNCFVPDVSFIRNDHIPTNWDIEKPHPGVPDLAVEIFLPGDDADDVLRKVRIYLAKGTEQVWVIYPKAKELHQYRRDENPEIRIYKGSASVDVEALFPGLELTTDTIFKLPAWAIKE